jgi:ribosomal protein L29
MAILRQSDIKKMSAEELQAKLQDLRLELMKSEAKRATHSPPGKTKEIKRTIARILTEIKIRENT